MTRFVISPRAKHSLIQISNYTHEQFGHRQRIKYLKALRSQMRQVSENPNIGRERDEIKTGYRSIVLGRHVIYFRMADAHIEVIDVLHQSMDPLIHL